MITQARWYGGSRYVEANAKGNLDLDPGVRVHVINVMTTGVVLRVPDAEDISMDALLMEGAPVFYIELQNRPATISNMAGTITAVVAVGTYMVGYAYDASSSSVIPTILYASPPPFSNTRPTTEAIFAGGGARPSTSNTQTRKYNPGTDVWAAGPAMAEGRAEGCAVNLGHMMVVSQDRSTLTNDTEKLDSLSASWAVFASNFTRRGRNGLMGFLNNRIVCFIGGNLSDPEDNFYADVEQIAWPSEVVAVQNQAPLGRTFGGLCHAPGVGRLLLLAGRPALSPSYSWHEATSSFETLTFYTGANRRSFASFYANGEAHVVYGHRSDTDAIVDAHDSYNPVTKTWTVQTAPGGTPVWECGGWNDGPHGMRGYVSGGLTTLPDSGPPHTTESTNRSWLNGTWSAMATQTNQWAANMTAGVVVQ